MYFANSLGMYVEYPQLSSTECLDLLLRTSYENPHGIHVIYGGGYDVTHMVRDFPMAQRKALRDDGRCSYLGYTLEYIPHKWLTIKGYWDGERRRMTLYDVMTFFQMSFVRACVSRGIEVPDFVVQGKLDRSSFRTEDLETIKVYTAAELRLLVELCETLRSEFREAGMPVRAYHGPGAVANAVMMQYRVKRHMQPLTPDIELLAQRAYFGGRFEPFQVGHTDEKVYQADVRSAYPDKIRLLPSLRSAHWEYRDSYTGELGIWRCTYTNDDARTLPHPIPWRHQTGAVAFSDYVQEVWLWTYEARHATDQYDGWALVIEDDTLPFSFVPGMYDTRQAWKAAGRGGQWALKLALNSLYGKTAQRVGGRDGKPPSYHQLVWAGMITSMTRAQMWSAIELDPESVISVETDSVTTTRKLDLDYGDGLGQWELSEFDWITYLQSGIYWTSAGQVNKAKTRGVDASELSHDVVMDYLAGDQAANLLLSTHRFISLTNPDITNYGQWIDAPRELSVNGGKRTHLASKCITCHEHHTLADRLHRMVPTDGMGVGPSKPHPLPWRPDVAPDVKDLWDTAESMPDEYE